MKNEQDEILKADPNLRAKPYDMASADTSPEAIAALRFGIPVSNADLVAVDAIVSNPSVDTKGRWGGCATLGPVEYTLWAVDGTGGDCGAIQKFSLAEVLEAGLRVKITGLSDTDKEMVIADCVADVLANLGILERDYKDLSAYFANHQGCEVGSAPAASEERRIEMVEFRADTTN
ncbi:hypothetical protein E2P84_43005 [Burkholderia cepacia]|uniref:Uncharacterized protein n=1 Tax=Burkholderia cepacia TaxID=292 RepID=A0AAX2RN18_BURCE|nr:hypothetical protein [Burkholderia cepacia]TES61932.1 hypothetical protein E2P84_43005 [Burkholderia cepacia]TET01731.1 hypothetical protein E3D36_16995 [Burkholderia cepacia]TEU47589.1 hypothetical protein E3D37_16425 [Burkholderia cepacia]TEU53461.1 hypothetical protein E3D38_12010 [Burkholderia cepacia]TEV02067.1 hypothetical protein E3D40_12940 [Burkholderia cepacia]